MTRTGLTAAAAKGFYSDCLHGSSFVTIQRRFATSEVVDDDRHVIISRAFIPPSDTLVAGKVKPAVRYYDIADTFTIVK